MRLWKRLQLSRLTLLLLLASCGSEETVAPDSTPPAAVQNLTTGSPASNSVLLTWTAPGDDGASGTANLYDIRFSTAGAITEATWAAARQASGEPAPAVGGALQSFQVTGLAPETPYWFALATADEVGNRSALSNSPQATTAAGFSDDFIRIPSGQFILGSPPEERRRDTDEGLHLVTLSRAFYICPHEVTQAEWRALMGWNHSDYLGEQRPVEWVTWFDCIDYCNRRSASAGFDLAYTISNPTLAGSHIVAATVSWNRDALGYRLPTEAEWEYACRAQSLTAYCNGDVAAVGCAADSNLTLVGWYCGNAGSSTHTVMLKLPNAADLYDMHGNVWEWCWDWYAPYPAIPSTDPTGGTSGFSRVMRGGAWNYNAEACRSAKRDSQAAGYSYHDIGLRLVRLAP